MHIRPVRSPLLHRARARWHRSPRGDDCPLDAMRPLNGATLRNRGVPGALNRIPGVPPESVVSRRQQQFRNRDCAAAAAYVSRVHRAEVTDCSTPT
ncbi:unnamed protein product [Euphydryas editha]|uniref:Uncharacterized protein n=1 Tax=Euphydryas editha TaxID=104508 RepID=A0AAU9U068_EUPED|nr:unnamed protein product [Euphydryas editha]